MKQWIGTKKRSTADETGAEPVEWLIVVAVLALAIVGGLSLLGIPLNSGKAVSGTSSEAMSGTGQAAVDRP